MVSKKDGSMFEEDVPEEDLSSELDNSMERVCELTVKYKLPLFEVEKEQTLVKEKEEQEEEVEDKEKQERHEEEQAEEDEELTEVEDEEEGEIVQEENEGKEKFELGIEEIEGDNEQAGGGEGVWIGIEIGEPKPRHDGSIDDGSIDGKRFFNAVPNCVVFAPPSKLTLMDSIGGCPEDVNYTKILFLGIGQI